MKILITTDWYSPVINGVVTSVMNLSNELTAQGHEVKILTLSPNHHSHQWNNVYYFGSVSAERIYPKSRLKIPIIRKQAYNLLKWKPDIVHSQCEFSTFTAARKISGYLSIPLVHTYHTIYEDYAHYVFPQKQLGRDIAIQFTKWVAGQVDCIVAPTDKIQRLLHSYNIDCPIDVIPTGIDLAKYKSASTGKEPLNVRAQLKIANDVTLLIYIGRLAKEKNIDELIEFQKANRTGKTMLLLVGDGPYREALEHKVNAMGLAEQVLFTGMVSPSLVPSYYQAGDLFVSGSTSETQGLTYAEALACGLPLLCRKDECLKDIIFSGENGWEYQTQSDFLDKLAVFLSLSEGERAAMRERSQKAAEVFSSRHFASEVYNVYTRALRDYKPKKKNEIA